MAYVWWLKPHTLVPLVLLPLFALLPFLPSPAKDVRTYFESPYYALGFVLLALLCVSSWAGSRPASRRRGGFVQEFAIRPLLLDVFFALSCAAYVIWFFEILINPSLLLLTTEAGAFAVRSQVSNIPGITSFTQAGVAFFICYAVATRYCNQVLHWRFRVYVAVLLLLTVLRVFVWTERLALLEIVIPTLILLLATREEQGGYRRPLYSIAPLLAIVFVLVLFGVTEYFRSWLDFYEYEERDFWSFILARVSTYYVTAVNNAVAYLSEDTIWPRWDGQFVLSGIYAMPGVGDFLRTGLELRPDSFVALLDSNLDPEFNNFSGLFFPVVDFGVVGGILVTIVMGVAAGAAWRGFANCSLGGLLFYPVIYMTLIELLRLFYIGGARTVIPLVLLLVAYGMGFRRARSRSRPLPPPRLVQRPQG